MVFSSIVFLSVFFPCIFLAHWMLPSIRLKNALLLLASLVFYAYGEPIYLFLLLASSFLNYLCALGVSAEGRKQKAVIVFAVVANLGILGFFKYAGMLVGTINSILATQFQVPDIPLPIGISFFTFQAMSYVIDVYRGNVEVQKNYGKVLLYISFFPQLIAGPIVKYRDICCYIDDRYVTAEKTALGIRRFIIGLSKKVLIANTVGRVADNIFSASPDEINIIAAWLGALAYLLQIYYDFSGYSDMAIGLGKTFGFEIQENFRYPYAADSVKEFWRRWHISLSSWFREYLYIPLGGNRKGKWRTSVNKLIVFFCTGLWHGANWTFVVWGLYHGCLLFMEDMFGKRKAPKFLRHLYLLVVVCIGFVIFRADTIGQALWMIQKMFLGFHFTAEAVCLCTEQMTAMFCTAMAVGIVGAFPVLPKLKKLLSQHGRAQVWYRGLSYVTTFALLLLCMIRLSGSTYNPFIYFRF